MGLLDNLFSKRDTSIKQTVREEYDKKFDSVISSLKTMDETSSGNWKIIGGDFGLGKAANAEEFIEQYREWVFANVNAVAEAVAEIEFKLYRYNKKADEVVEIHRHEILELLNKVNPFMTKGDFIYLLQTYLLLSGEAPIRLKRATSDIKSPISELWPINPVQFDVKVGRAQTGFEMILEYIIRSNSKESNNIILKPWEVVFLKNIDPERPWRGIGTVEASARSIDILNYSETYNLNFFKNSAVPYTVLMTDQKLNDNTVERLRTMWHTNYGGFENAFKTAILEQGLQIKQLQSTARDMDYLDQQKFLRDKLMSMFRTSKVIMGITEDVNRASAEASEYVFMKYCVRPKMRKLIEYLNEFLVPLFDDSGDIFLDFVNPVKNDNEQKIKEWSFAVDKWMTKNEVRDENGLPPLEGGDEIWQPLSLVPLGMAPELHRQSERVGPNNITNDNTDNSNNDVPNPATSTDPIKSEIYSEEISNNGNGYLMRYRILRSGKKKNIEKFREQVSKLINRNVKIQELNEEFKNQLKAVVKSIVINKTPEKKILKPMYKGINDKDFLSKENINKFEDRVEKNNVPYEKKIQDIVQKIYDRQEYDIISNIKKSGSKQILKRGRVAEKTIEDNYMFNKDEYIKDAVIILSPILLELIKTQGKEAENLISIEGFRYRILDEVRKYLNSKPLQSAKSFNDFIYQKVRKSLADGVKNNDSTEKLIKRVKDEFKSLEDYQAERIARSEVYRATNFALLDCYRQSGVVKSKKWVTAKDELVCGWCGPLDGKTIGLDEFYFQKGSQYIDSENKVLNLNYDHIDGGCLHVNCRCKVVPVFKSVSERSTSTQNKAEKLLADIESQLKG
jgi:HK97 family phage portal protein